MASTELTLSLGRTLPRAPAIGAPHQALPSVSVYAVMVTV